MPNIPRHKRRVKPSAEVGGVLTPYDTADFGEEKFWEGMKDLGRGIGKAGEFLYKTELLIQKVERDSQFSTARREANESINALNMSLSKNPDFTIYQGRYEETLKEIQRNIPTNREAQEYYKNWLDYKIPIWQENINRTASRRQIHQIDVDSLINLNTAKRTGDKEEAMQAINERVKHLLWTEKEGKEAERTLDSEMAYYEASNKLRDWTPVTDIDDPAKLFDLADFTVAEAVNLFGLEFDNLKDLTPKHKKLLMKDVKTLVNDRKKEAQEKLDAIQEQTDIDFFSRYGVDLLPSEVVQAVTQHRLSREAGDRWLSGLADPRDYPTDPNVEATLLRQISDPAFKITKSDILDLVGKPKGLSVATARQFISDIDMLKDPWFRRIDSWLKGQLGWDAAYEKWLYPAGGIAYKVIIDRLFGAIETEKLRGKDIYDRGTQLAIPAIIDYWENVMFLEKSQIEQMIRLLKEGETQTTPQPKGKGVLEKPVKLKSLVDPEGIF